MKTLTKYLEAKEGEWYSANPFVWGDITFEFIADRAGYCIARCLPLELEAEGVNEKEATAELLMKIWSKLAHMTAHLYKRDHKDFSILKMVQELSEEYWATHDRPVVVKDEKMAVIEIVLEVNEDDIRSDEDAQK